MSSPRLRPGTPGGGGRPPEISGLRLARLLVGTALAEEVLHRGVLPAAVAHLAGNITGLGAVTAS